MSTRLVQPFTTVRVAAANFLTGSSNLDQTSYTTASGTPVARRLYLAFVCNTVTGVTAAIPTVTGQGQTWDLVTTVINAANSRRLSVFRAWSTSPTAGTLTIDFAGQGQLGCEWSVITCTGADTSGTNGSAAIAQTKTQDNATNALGASVTLDAPPASTSALVAGFTHGISETSTATAPAVKLGDTNHSSPARGTATAWASNPGSSIAMTWATTSTSAAIAVEVKAA